MVKGCANRLNIQNSKYAHTTILPKKLKLHHSKHIVQNNIPKGWTYVSLSTIAELNPKKPQYDEKYAELDVSFIPMKCVEEQTGKIIEHEIKKYSHIKNGYTCFKNNDIIFAKITPCMENGKIALITNLKNHIGFGSTEFHVIRLHDTAHNKFYLWYLLQENIRNTAKNNMRGTAGQLRIPVNYLKNIIVPFPPINEQKRIASKIESIFAQIDTIEKYQKSVLDVINKLKISTLKQAFEGKLIPQDPSDEPASILLKRLRLKQIPHVYSKIQKIPPNWIEVTLKTICSTVTKIDPKLTPNRLFHYCDIGSIDNKNLKILKPKKIKGRLAPSRARQIIQTNDILFSTVRTYLKNFAMVPSELNSQIASTGFCVIRIHPTINHRLIFYYIQTNQFLDKLNKLQRGSSYPAIRNNDVLNSTILLPPLNEQKRIASKIESIFNKINTINKDVDDTLHSLKLLKRSVLKHAFEGKLVPQNPIDIV